MQRSNVALPLAGRCSGIGLPASEQELFATKNKPSAATFRSTSWPCALTLAVVGSTKTMSLPAAAGAVLLSAIASLVALVAATTLCAVTVAVVARGRI